MFSGGGDSLAFNDKSNNKSQAGHSIRFYMFGEVCRMFLSRFKLFLKSQISKIGDRINPLDMIRR